MTFRKLKLGNAVPGVVAAAVLLGLGWECGATAPQSAMNSTNTRVADTLRSWTPRDSIGVTYYVSDQEQPDSWTLGALTHQRPDVIVPSPNGEYFFYVTHRGDLPSDTNIY